jgi:hypothetical protein
MEAYDPVSYDAFVRLMARPDPRDLPRRAHVHRLGTLVIGRENRA